MKILVVDDKEENRYLLETLLTGNGFVTRTATNGKEALELLRSEEVGLIISDILMPVMDGFQLCREVKEDDELAKLPFVFYSATYTEAKDEEYALSIGADRYVRKPVEPAKFMTIIHNIIDDVKTGKLRGRKPVPAKEGTFKRYSERLVNKLEKKMLQLKETEKEYRALFENVSDVVFWLDEEGRFTAVNPQITVIGYEPQDVIGKRFTEFLTPWSQEIALHHFESAKEDVTTHDVYELEVVRQDDGIAHVEVSMSTAYEDEEFLGRFCILRDITTRKRAEKELRVKDCAVECAINGVAFVDPDWNLTYVNPSFVSLWGYENDGEVVGRKATEFWQDRSAAEQGEKAVEEEGEWRGELTAKRKDGTLFLVEAIADAVTDDKGTPMTMMVSFMDITERKQTVEQRQRTLQGTIKAVGLTTETRDPYTFQHQQRVTELACAIAEQLDLPEEQIKGLRAASLMHDIGKLSVPAEILSKPTKLTDAEYKLIQVHPQTAYDIIAGVDFPWPVADIILQHHERLDGSGYPNSLTSDDILLEAKVLAVADVVEAMSSHRPYRPSLGLDKALDEINNNKGKLYDPDVVDACLKLFEENGFSFVTKDHVTTGS